jgi:hypothetical protein
LTTGADSAGVGSASNAGLASSFRFTSGNETVDALSATTAGGDTLVDASTTDADVLNLTATGSTTALTAINIETANVNFASGSPDAKFTNFSGLNTVNVTGAVAGTVEDTGTATIALNGYKRVLTVDIDSLAGTAVAGNADSLNVSVSGSSWGTTAATQTGLYVTVQSATNATDGVLETLNITSDGSAANDFTLTKDADTTLSTVNLLGATDITMRVANDDVTGIAIAGAANTATTTVIVDRAGKTTTDTNAQYWTGIDNIVVRDSTTPSVSGDGADLALLKSAQVVTLASDFNATVLSVEGAATGTQTLTVNLDNSTAESDTDVASIEVQDVESITINSNGYATASGTSAQNLIDDLYGDFTTVTIGGDTSLDLDLSIEGAGSTSTKTARAVTVTAASNTAFVDITANASTVVSYTITGSNGSDSITGNDLAGVLNGGAGNDTITGGTGNDSTTGGDGNDTIVISYGTDTVAGGAGNDTYDINSTGVTAVQEKQTITAAIGTTAAADGTFVLTILGENALVTTVDADTAATTAAKAVAALQGTAAFVGGRFAVGAVSSGAFTVTFAATEGNVADITIRSLGETSASDTDRTETTTETATSHLVSLTSATDTSSSSANATGVLVRDTNTRITDFADGDILDVLGLISGAKTYVEGAGSTGNVQVLTTAYATVAEAEDAVDGITSQSGAAFIIYLDTALGCAVGFYDSDTAADGNLTSYEVSLTGITTVEQLAAAFKDGSVI